MTVVLAAPQHNAYDRDGAKVLEVNQNHWSSLNPHRYGSGHSHELQRLWDSLLVKKTQNTYDFLFMTICL